MLKQFNRWLLILGGLTMLPACSNNVTWKEEVKLNDGRVIVITQERKCETAYDGHSTNSCLAREAWLRFQAPEFGTKTIQWHEHLHPLILNVHQGEWFIVSIPPTQREFYEYGQPQPGYIGFKLIAGSWKRIAFLEIPISIYDTNLLITTLPPSEKQLLTIAIKESITVNGDPGISKSDRRVDPLGGPYQDARIKPRNQFKN